MKNWIKDLEIKVRKDQKKWLNTLYGKIYNKEEVSYKILRTELYNEVDQNFDPDSIDYRLASFRGTEITILGVDFLHPEKKIFQKIDLVIKAIRELLLENPILENAELKQIQKKTGIENKELDQIMFFIATFREPSFSNGSSGNSEYRCNSLSVRDDNIFDNYLNYKTIDLVIDSWLKNVVERRSPDFESKNTMPLKGRRNNTFLSKQNFGGERDENYVDGIYCKPIFKSPAPKVNENICFVLMPFGESWSDEVWSNMIRPAVEVLGLQCIRADSTHGLSIIEDIWTSINQCALIIADLSNVNPNVMYEMGIVHTIGKPCIMITQDLDNTPFDVSHLRQYPYSISPSGSNNLKVKIHEVIGEVYTKNYPEFTLKS